MNPQIIEQISNEVKALGIPERIIESAQAIIARRGIVMAKVNEEGEAITPTIEAYAVIHPMLGRSNNWKIVRPFQKKCNCGSDKPCAHRIAVYIYKETIKRESGRDQHEKSEL